MELLVYIDIFRFMRRPTGRTAEELVFGSQQRHHIYHFSAESTEGPEAHPACYTMDTMGFPLRKAAGA
jgi:hypothetical protein